VNKPVNLLNFDHQGLRDYFHSLGEKPFRATQVLKWIHQQGVFDFDQMTNLSKALRERLKTCAQITLPEIATTQASSDGTRKWLLRLDGGNTIETVFIPEGTRGTLCVSSQVGCILDCSFCSTAQQGFNRNLTTAEIIGQLWFAEHALREEGHASTFGTERAVTNVVMMGMGEPLANYDSVVTAMKLMLDDNAYGLSWRRVTLSTSGIVPPLARLKEDCHVSLAISLHATDDNLRDELVPINKKYPIKELIQACHAYVDVDQRRHITFEYVMLKGINDNPKQARQLITLLQGLRSKVNLIPFNPFPNTHYECSSTETIERFRDILMKAGVITMTRKTRGDDIDAACGQLAGKVQDRTHRQLKNIPIYTEEKRT